MASVFLSYSREDRARAQQVVAALEAGGVSVWWDGLIEGGERFSHATEAALDGADVVVVLWSKTSVKSHWVHDEATRGRDRGRLVPASIDGAAPPLGFGQFQALDLSKWKGKAGAPEIDGLLRAIAIAAGQKEADRPNFTSGTASPNRRALLIGGGVMAALATGGVAAWQFDWFTPAGVANSVAVLPFKNLSGDSKQDYFSEGLAEEIRAALARNSLLKVTATTSAAMFKERNIAVPEIAKQLGVAHILEGSVRRFGEQVRIGVQLINGADGRTGWSRTFEESFSDLFEMQARIAQTISDVLTAQATGRGVSQDGNLFSSNGGTANSEAFDAFLQGMAAFDRSRVSDNYLEELALSLSFFDRAIALDPNYAAALAGRSRYYTRVGRIKDDITLLKLGFEDAQKCIDLAPDFADGYAVMGYAWIFYKFNVSGSDKFYQRARELGWGDVKALMGYQGYCAGWWKLAEAEEAIQRMIALDPLSFPVQMRLIELRVAQERYDEALEVIDRHVTEGKQFSELNYWAIWAHIGRKEFDLAKKKTAKLSGEFDKEMTFAEIALAEGNGIEFEKRGLDIINRFEKKTELIKSVQFFKAIYFAYINKLDNAVALLEDQYNRHNSSVLQMRDSDTLEKKLGEHPRYIKLYQKMGLTGKPVNKS